MKLRRMLCKVLVFVVIAIYSGLFGVIPASAATLEVGPGRAYSTPQAAFNAAAAGDTILIYADGTYTGSNCLLNMSPAKNNITIRGVAAGGNSRPSMVSNGVVSGQKGLWRTNGSGVTIENIEFSGAHDTSGVSRNYAGIRVDDSTSGTLNLKNCYFHNNDNGVLTSNTTTTAGMTLNVENCEFNSNGYGDGYSHNMYIGTISNFYLRYSYSTHVKSGHLVKTRSDRNFIEYNRITDESTDSTWNSNYNIDMPEGGYCYIVGNLFHQGTTAPNNTMVAYAMENTNNPGKHCYVINNTFVNDYSGGYFLRGRNDAAYTVTNKNNIFTGAGTITTGSCAWDSTNNLNNIDPGYINKAGYDYRLSSSSSQAVDAGVNPGSSAEEGYSLVPVKHYEHKCSSSTRTTSGSGIDIGAYEYPIVSPSPSPSPTPVNGSGNGLKGEYYDNMDFTGLKAARVDTSVNFNWGSGSPDATVSADTFTVRWAGKVQPKYSQTYTFYTTTDDGVKLWVNNQLLIDKWVNQSATEWSGSISLTAGQKYDIRMDYFENGGNASAVLSWSSSSQSKQVIPQSQLYSSDPAPTPLYSKALFADGTYSLGSGNTGKVNIEFDITPFLNNNDNTVGYADTSTTITHWSGCPVIVRLNSSGYIDVRNGGDYSALASLSYSANTKYHVKIVANLSTKLYDVWVTPSGGAATQLALNYAFRTDAPATDDFGKVNLKTASDNESKVENHIIVTVS